MVVAVDDAREHRSPAGPDHLGARAPVLVRLLLGAGPGDPAVADRDRPPPRGVPRRRCRPSRRGSGCRRPRSRRDPTASVAWRRHGNAIRVCAGHLQGIRPSVATIDDTLAVRTAPARTRKGPSTPPARSARRRSSSASSAVGGGCSPPCRSWASSPCSGHSCTSTRSSSSRTRRRRCRRRSFDRDGELAQLHATVDRTIIDLEDMPRVLRNAVIAVEDKAFYDHPGFDPIGIVRAAWTDIVSGEVVQGASTITQQLVKNVYAGHYDRTRRPAGKRMWSRRVVVRRSARSLLAIKVERTFQGRDPRDVPQHRVLRSRRLRRPGGRADVLAEGRDGSDLARVGHPRGRDPSPGFYDPVEHAEEAMDRRNYVLDQMVDAGFLAPAGRPRARRPGRTRSSSGVDFSAKLGVLPRLHPPRLIDQHGEATVYGGGLRVTTTIDMDMQRAAQEAVATHLPDPEDPDAALVAIDPRTGGILAMYGGRNFERDKVNLATGPYGGGGAPGGVGVQGLHPRRGARERVSARLHVERPVLDHRSRTSSATPTARRGSCRTRATRRTGRSRSCRRRRTRSTRSTRRSRRR